MKDEDVEKLRTNVTRVRDAYPVDSGVGRLAAAIVDSFSPPPPPPEPAPGPSWSKDREAKAARKLLYEARAVIVALPSQWPKHVCGLIDAHIAEYPA